MICSKCGFDCIFLKDGLDGQPTCSFCASVSVARPGYENAALANALISEVAKYFIPEESILDAGEDAPLLKRGRGRPRKS